MGKIPVSTSMWKRFSDYLTAYPLFKNISTQKIFFRSKLNCSRARHIYREQELRNVQPKLQSLLKSGGEGSLD